MPSVEGFTPDVFWTTMYGFIALCVLVVIVLNAYEKIRAIRERRKQQIEAQQPGLADQISRKVLEQLEPRFREIEDKLQKDENRLDNHETLFNRIQDTNKEIRAGLHAYGKTMLVLLNHGNFGSSTEVKEATDELNKFLAERV